MQENIFSACSKYEVKTLNSLIHFLSISFFLNIILIFILIFYEGNKLWGLFPPHINCFIFLYFQRILYIWSKFINWIFYIKHLYNCIGFNSLHLLSNVIYEWICIYLFYQGHIIEISVCNKYYIIQNVYLFYNILKIMRLRSDHIQV